MLGRIFAHRRGARTVVQAPLVRLDEPAPPEHRPHDPPPPEPPSSGGAAATDEDAVVAAVADEADEADEVAPATADPVVPRQEPGERATRYCGMCGQRVPLDADGLRCHLGHRLSPAHASGPRRGWLRRLFGRG